MVNACKRGYLSVCRQLVTLGVCEDVNQVLTPKGSTALRLAASHGYFGLARYLVTEAGAKVNEARPTDGITAVYRAAQKGHLDIVRFLALEAHANVNQATTDDGTTPLMIAASYEHLKVVRFLVQAGANVNQTDGDGKTALFDASNDGQVEICGRLLIAGANAQPRDFQDERQLRKAQVLDWADERLACHHCFMSVVLFAMHRSSGTALSLVMVGGRENVKRLVAEFLDIQIGRELRNLRAIRPALQAL